MRFVGVIDLDSLGTEILHEGVDILVVASGFNEVSPIVDMDPQRFEKIMLANVDGPWLIARAVGTGDVADSLAAIREVVFESGFCTLNCTSCLPLNPGQENVQIRPIWAFRHGFVKQVDGLVV